VYIMSDETTGGETADAGTAPSVKRRRRGGLIVLAVLALVAGVVGSWAYNRDLSARQTNDTAAVRAATDPSTYVTPGDYSEVTVPIRNDGPLAITVIGLYLPTAPRLLWDGAWTVIQPGATAELRVQAPFGCSAIPHTLKHAAAVPVLLRVQTANGNSHASLRTTVNGMIQYAADYCPAPTLTKKKDDSNNA
jgi:hypothetical protein